MQIGCINIFYLFNFHPCSRSNFLGITNTHFHIKKNVNLYSQFLIQVVAVNVGYPLKFQELNSVLF